VTVGSRDLFFSCSDKPAHVTRKLLVSTSSENASEEVEGNLAIT
jgi:hypothetical protein